MKELMLDINKFITDEDIRELAERYDIPYAALKAVISVETLSKGFYDNTLIPVVRLENHKFSKHTNGIYDFTHPNLSSKTFTNKYNLLGISEFHRFLEAYKLDKDAAIKATSWGLGQVLGENYSIVYEESPLSFMQRMFESEYAQLEIMMNFIQANNLLIDLRTRNWEHFALVYNGKNYKKNNYHTKLSDNFKKFNR